MIRLLQVFISLIIFALFIVKSSYAATVLEDSFIDMSKIDQNKTTALVDTAAGEITLNRAKLPNAVAVGSNGSEYAAIDGDGVSVFNYDTSTNKMVKNESMSVMGVTDPVGIAFGQNNYSVWVLTKSEIKRYDYTENGMTFNPYLSVTGLNEVFSISVNPIDNTVVVLSQDTSKKGVVSTFKQTEEGKLQSIPQMTFTTDIESPSSLSIAPDTGAIAVSSKDSISYYSFDESNCSYAKNILMSTATGNPVVSVSMQKSGNGYVSLGVNSLDSYMYDVELSKVAKVPTLSTTLQSKYNYSVSLNTDRYEYAILNDEGNVEYWMFDESTQSMKRNSTMEVGGINIKNRYDSPADYVSTIITTDNDFDQVRITSQEVKPDGAAITWSVSEDNGSTWIEVVANEWKEMNLGRKLCIKATLKATEGGNVDPPKIQDVKVEVTFSGISNVECVAITKNHKDQVLPTKIFPVKAKKGSQVVFTVDSTGFIEEITAEFSTGEKKELIPEDSITAENNKWLGSITFEPDDEEGRIIGVRFEGVKKGKKFNTKIDKFIVIDQYVIYDMDIQLKK